MTEMTSNHVLYIVAKLVGVLMCVGNARRGFIDACFSFAISSLVSVCSAVS